MQTLSLVVNRVLADPSFQRALQHDPDRALADYALSIDERQSLDAFLTHPQDYLTVRREDPQKSWE
jgi:hypothetical protein